MEYMYSKGKHKFNFKMRIENKYYQNMISITFTANTKQ